MSCQLLLVATNRACGLLCIERLDGAALGRSQWAHGDCTGAAGGRRPHRGQTNARDLVSRAERGQLTPADKSNLDSMAEALPWTALQYASLHGLQTAAKNILDSKASVDKPNKASNVSDNDVNASSENELWR
eukprot:g21211.t1